MGDFVWKDLDKDGQQDSGEWGISGVTVKLLNCATPPAVLSTTTTDSYGKYLFSNLSAGSYAVEFVLPSGYAFTLQNTGADATDSDANTGSPVGRTGCYVLDAGENERTVDAGLIHAPKASLGDRVWKDLNKNGIQDSGEWNLSGYTVKLWTAQANGTKIAHVATDVTDSNGLYRFDNLTPGQPYVVEFIIGSDYDFTTANVGSNDSRDSDPSKTTGVTGAYVLAAGQYNDTVDAGLVIDPCSDLHKRVYGYYGSNCDPDCDDYRYSSYGRDNDCDDDHDDDWWWCWWNH